MGLSSGGGFGGGFHGVFVHGGYSSDVDIGTVISLGAVLVLVLGTGITVSAIQNKAINNAKNLLADKIVYDMNEKDLQSVNVEHFDWITDNVDYFFKFTGNAITVDGKEIDFISASYKVNEQQYYDVITYVDKKNVKSLDNSGVLQLINEILDEENVELTSKAIIENVASGKAYGKSKSVVLEVSKPKVWENEIGYYVSKADFIKIDNAPYLVSSCIKVSFPLTNELKKNPAKVFLSKEGASHEVYNQAMFKIETNQVYDLNNEEICL